MSWGSRHHLQDTCFNFVENCSRGPPEFPGACGELKGHVPVCPPALGGYSRHMSCVHIPGPYPSLPNPSRLLWESLGLCDWCVMFSTSKPCSSRSSVQRSPESQARTLMPICDPSCLSRAKDTIRFCWFSQHCYPHSLLPPTHHTTFLLAGGSQTITLK